MSCRGGRLTGARKYLCHFIRASGTRPYSSRSFTSAVRAEIAGALPAAAAFPRLYGRFHAAFGTEIGTVFRSAYTAPFLAVPHGNSLVLRSHAEKRFAVGHILQAHNGKTEYKHKRHLIAIAATLYSQLSCIFRRIPILSMISPRVL